MKEIKNVKSQIKPVDMIETDTGVFIHTNIREEVEEDPVFKTTETIYVYDETQYTYQEWYAITIKELKEEIEVLKKDVNELKLK